jgi:hypothetical protein
LLCSSKFRLASRRSKYESPHFKTFIFNLLSIVLIKVIFFFLFRSLKGADRGLLDALNWLLHLVLPVRHDLGLDHLLLVLLVGL